MVHEKNINKIYHIELGLTDFKNVWEFQKTIFKYKQNNKFPDVILTTQHRNVYTLGKSGDKDHLLLNDDELKEEDISFYEIDRGGDLTYHGPGQLVAYPVFNLNNYYLDTHRFLRDMERAVIMSLKSFGIEAAQDEEYTGVWVEQEKICAIGIKVSRWITMHGLALNVNNDLSYFDKIIPCGIFHKGVTSMSKITHSCLNINKISEELLLNFQKVFDLSEIKSIGTDELLSMMK